MKFKFRIYTPAFVKKTGGIVVLFTLGLYLHRLGHECKMIDARLKNRRNQIYNNYTTHEDVNDCIVIYPEIIRGNPLKATKIIRWILCSLESHCDPEIYKSWNKNDIVYYYSSYNPVNTNNLKYLNCIFLFSEFKNYNLERINNCFEYRKALRFHKEIKEYHNKNDYKVIEDNKIDVFNKSKYYYCYDPYTYNMVLAGFCGCIPIVYPIEGVSKKQWTDSLYCYNYLKSINKDYMYGIAYGIEDLEYAKNTFNLLIEEQKNIVDFINKSVKSMCDDLINNDIKTVEDIYYNK